MNNKKQRESDALENTMPILSPAKFKMKVLN